MTGDHLADVNATCETGQTWPMGASCLHWGGRVGVNFSVFSRHASAISVCLFEASGQHETARISLKNGGNGLWHGFVAGLGAGQLYGLRADGPDAPEQGHRFNSKKLLLDPFARAIQGETHNLSLELDPHDNAARMPKARVLDLHCEVRAGAELAPGPEVPLAQTVLYEAHVKGLTQLHPDVPANLRGTYAGLASPPMLAHYQRLGITTLCLLPVHLFITESHLLKKGLHNYWGYNTLGYFIPDPRYASGQFSDDRAEFRHMVDQLHLHGFEVVLDVVFNHSGEGEALGPTLSWRGLDNASWYALDCEVQYLNFSGCGNSFDLTQPCAVQLVMDSLRWWVQAFGVDGFRFDLATVLGRDPRLEHQFHPRAALLSAIGQDPVLARVKLLAEPWDVGPGGYQLGKFPPGWHEWNDRFRDTCRAFWLGFGGTRGALAQRLTGSSDYFQASGRSPLASVNLITAHDGMTLADLTSYSHKHNLANGEANQDGHDHNLSANAGVEGPTDDAAVLAVRGQWCRALLATLFCSQGVPQLLAGDEIGHSQNGNNNAYCQDNETTWLDWPGADPSLCNFVADLIQLRGAHAALRHARWFTGEATPAHVGVDLAWRQPNGSALSGADWDDPQARSFACLIDVADDGLAAIERWLLLFHAGPDRLPFALPPGQWQQVLDSAAPWVLPFAQWPLAPLCLQSFTPSPRSVCALVQCDLSISPAP
jgi:glycogen operon protein